MLSDEAAEETDGAEALEIDLSALEGLPPIQDRPRPRDRVLHEGRFEMAWRALVYGIGIGACAGAFSGTLIVPLWGTAFGLWYGFLAALAPSLLGAALLVASGRPGTPQAVYRRRARLSMAVVGVVLVLGFAVLGDRLVGMELWADLARDVSWAGVVTALALLALATERLAAIEVAPEGRRDHGGWWFLGVVTLVIGSVVVPLTVTRLWGTTAQRARIVKDLRDDLADAASLEADERTEYDTGHGDAYCGRGSERFYAGSYYVPSDPDAGPDDVLDVIEAELVARGFRTTRRVEDDGTHGVVGVHGRWEARSEARDDGSGRLSVHVGNDRRFGCTG